MNFKAYFSRKTTNKSQIKKELLQEHIWEAFLLWFVIRRDTPFATFVYIMLEVLRQYNNKGRRKKRHADWKAKNKITLLFILGHHPQVSENPKAFLTLQE